MQQVFEKNEAGCSVSDMVRNKGLHVGCQSDQRSWSVLEVECSCYRRGDGCWFDGTGQVEY